ncbi:MAG TPA: hypothetical protein VNU84_02175 [Candidatus Acidoferrum sp.]|jgi:hypothetical protein|nr:hypothetical protein [Candidatus Acidoferrum sp.]
MFGRPPSRKARSKFAGLSYAAVALLALIVTAHLLLPAHTSALSSHSRKQASSSRPTFDFSGSVASHDAGRLHLATELGSIVVHTHETGSVDYKVHIETDSGTKDADRLMKSFRLRAQPVEDGVWMHGATSAKVPTGRLWVTLELTVPKNYSLDVTTGVGNISVDDLNGRETLLTQGGNIATGNINGSAHLTAVAGGHITVKNVMGELNAETGGGHITTGTVSGNAFLHTHGGHIRSDSIAGTAHLVTDGGNITLERSGSGLLAETAGGQIQVGEAAGLVRAKTGDGGIRVVRSSGPATLEAPDGSIYLTQADGSVKASTATGGITAWFVSPPKDSGECQLESNSGDIVVYIGRTLPVTIDAQVQMGQSHGFIIDPAFAIAVRYEDGARGQRIAHAQGMLNGGGQVLRLRTVAGNIRLVASDVGEQMHMYRQQMEGLQKQLNELQKSIFPGSQQANENPRQP